MAITRPADDILVPHFTYGTYTSEDGSPLKFTDELMRQIARNTNFAIDSKILTPPVTYDEIDEHGRYKHNSSKSTDAHGAVTRALFQEGVLHFGIKPSATLRADVRDTKRLRVSGVVRMSYGYNDATGKRVELGPTLVATTALGNRRHAIQNPKIVPLADLPFSEDTNPVDAWNAREELRKSGFIAQTLADGSYAFSEINIDPDAFGEPERQEQTMTPEEIKALIAAETAPLKADNIALKADNEKLRGEVKEFSETSQRKNEAVLFFAEVAKVKPLGKLTIDRGVAFAQTLNAEQLKDFKAFTEGLPAFLIPGGRAGERNGDPGGDGDGPEPPEEPKALASIRPKHFSEPSKYDAQISQAMDDLQKIQPKLFAEAKAVTLDQRRAVTKQYVIEREADAN